MATTARVGFAKYEKEENRKIQKNDNMCDSVNVIVKIPINAADMYKSQRDTFG